MNPVIERLAAAATPINFWLGSECSASMFSWSEAETLKFVRLQNPQVGQTLSLVETFSAMSPDRREAFRTSFCSRMNWCYPSVANIAAQGRAGAIVMRGIDGALPKLLAARDMLPIIESELGTYESDSPNGLRLLELPLLREPSRWREVLTAFPGPWVILGVPTQPPAVELELLQTLSGAVWVQNWNEPAPAGFETVAHYDADSFVMSLCSAITGSIPLPPATKVKPEGALDALAHHERAAIRDASSGLGGGQWVSQDLTDLDDAEFHDRLNLRLRVKRKLARLSPDSGYGGYIDLYHGARNNASGKRAERMLAMAAEELAKERWGEEPHRVSLRTRFFVEIEHERAKLRRPTEAKPFYRAIDAAIRALPPGEPRYWENAVSFANALSDWAAIKSTVEAELIVREAIEVLRRPFAAGPLRACEEAVLHNTETVLLRAHALRLDKTAAEPFFQEAYAAASRLEAIGEDFRAEYLRGMLSLSEARLDPQPDGSALIAQGNLHFTRALELAPASSTGSHIDWGTALYEAGFPKEALEHYQIALDANKNSASLHNNWCGVLQREARKAVTMDEREALLAEAELHAIECEKVMRSRCAYGMASIAAERGANRDEIEKWLRLAARGPKLAPPAHIDADPAFDHIRNEPWFQQMLLELYP